VLGLIMCRRLGKGREQGRWSMDKLVVADECLGCLRANFAGEGRG